MIYTGIDIIEIDRIKKVYLQYPKRFMTKIFTEKEISYCKGRYPQIAARFACKEAVMKFIELEVKLLKSSFMEMQNLKLIN